MPVFGIRQHKFILWEFMLQVSCAEKELEEEANRKTQLYPRAAQAEMQTNKNDDDVNNNTICEITTADIWSID